MSFTELKNEGSQKVFFLGASKMATKSLTLALKEHGLRVCHSTDYGLYSHLPKKSDYFERFDYFLDGNLQNFLHLKEWFPNAKFILLERDLVKWVTSLYAWNENSTERNMVGENYVRFVKWIFNGRSAFNQIVGDLLIYQTRAKHYFAGDSHFLTLDVEEEGEDGWRKLSLFLNIELKVKHGNKQMVPRSQPWISEVVEAANQPIRGIALGYPDLRKKANIRVKLFHYSCRTLANSFNMEKRLMRNLRKSFSTFNDSPAEASKDVALRIRGFLKIMFCLGLRYFTIPDRVVSPFLL